MNKKASIQIITLLGLIILFYLLTLVSMLIFQAKGVEPWRMLMATSALQNIGVFIIPAVITARIFNPGKTLQTLQLNRIPGFVHWVLMLLIYLASIPMMNAIVLWNEGWQLPETLSWMREMEDAAKVATEQMLNVTSIGQLLIVILIVGILTGVGEELIFRGSVQRLMLEKKINPHIAIWATAFIFSAIHFQAYGFVPRMLLGAFFGYTALWSGSLWLPIAAHALNNSLTTITYYEPTLEQMTWIGTEPTTTTVVCSTIATITLIVIYVRYYKQGK